MRPSHDTEPGGARPPDREPEEGAAAATGSLTRLEEVLAGGLAAWVAGVGRRARILSVGLLALSLALGLYAGLHLGINTDTTRLVDPDLPTMRAQREFSELFPILDSAIIVVIDGETAGSVRRATDALAERLRRDPDHFARVFEPGGGAFFERNGLLYQRVEDLEEFADQLVAAQPLLAELERDSSAANLASLVRQGLAALDSGDPRLETWSGVLDRMRQAAVAVYTEYPVSISWEELLLRGSSLEVEPRRVLMVEPVLDIGSLLPAGRPLSALRAHAAALDTVRDGQVRVRLTGNPALNHEEMFGLATDIGIAGGFCFLLVAGVLYMAMRSWALVAASLTTLLAGLLCTAAFAATAVGHVNLVSICFAVLFIGLGVDFAIHLCLQVVAGRSAGLDHPAAMDRAARGVGCSLVLCAVTTAIGFFVFVPTDYLGVAELGLISGTGMFVMLFMNLTLLPALLASWLPYEPDPRSEGDGEPEGPASRALELLRTLPTGPAAPWIRAFAPLLGVCAVLVLPQIRFDADVVKMRDPDTESVQVFEELLERPGMSSPWLANALEGDLASAERLAERVRGAPGIGDVLHLGDFVPGDQEEKQEILLDLALVLDVPPRSGRPPSPPPARQVEALRDLRDYLDLAVNGPDAGVGSPITGSMQRLSEELTQLLARIEADEDPALALETFEEILLGRLPEQLARLRRALEPETITLENLPSDLRERMIAEDGRARVQIFPAEGLDREDFLDDFVEAVRSVVPGATGMSVNLYEFGQVTIRSLRQALASAVVAIALLLFLLWRHPRPMLLVLAPIGLGAVWTGGLMVVLGMPLNFANVIVIPLLLGMGVDSAIHLVHRSLSEGLPADELMHSPTARAVVYSALTTVVSFGSLVLSSHRGMVSLGQLLVIGMALMLAANLVVLPSWLAVRPPVPASVRRDEGDAADAM